jgi:ribonuclease HI
MSILKHSNPKVEIYTDGSCDPNPGPGGWAALILEGKDKKTISGFAEESTNNRMELTAALEALRKVDVSKPVKIFTDSQYLQKGVEEWLANWKAHNWKRKSGVLANIDLWKAISEEISRHKITWRWIKGHAGNPLNEQVDRLAQQARLTKGK